MKFIKTEIRDVVIIEPIIFGDERGYFFESFNTNLLTNQLNLINKVYYSR